MPALSALDASPARAETGLPTQALAMTLVAMKDETTPRRRAARVVLHHRFVDVRVPRFTARRRRVDARKRHDDLRAIKRLAACRRSGWLTGDTDALLRLYADRPVLMPQGQPPVFGRDAIRALYRAVFNEVTIRSRGRLVEVEASGDWGYFWSTYHLTATPKAGGQPIQSEGKSLFIVKRQRSGAWKIARLIDNSNR